MMRYHNVHLIYEGLYLDLKMELPKSVDAVPATDESSPVIFIHGGSSAIGATAIQFSRLSGYRVISTSSSANFDLVKSFGAEAVFDHKVTIYNEQYFS